METHTKNLQLVVGPYRSGKTNNLIAELVSFCHENPLSNTLVIVPSARYRNLLQEKIKATLEQNAQDKFSGLMGLRILTFHEICQYVLDAYDESVEVISDPLRPLIIAKCISKLMTNNRISALSGIAGFAGTYAALLELIDEFERSGYSPSDVQARLNSSASVSSKYYELALIYEQYWLELSELKLVDQKQIAFRARNLLFSPATKDLQIDLLAIDGFDRLSRLQAQIIKGLSFTAKRTKILFDYLSDAHEYEWKQESYADLIEVLGIDSSAAETEKKQLPSSVYFSCADRYFEMQEIARRCKESVVVGKVKAQDLLVTARNLKSYRGAIEAAFEDAGLSYFIDESTQIAELPVVHFVRMLLQLSANDFRAEQLIACLQSHYCRLNVIGLTAQMVEELDRETWKFGLIIGKTRWQEYLAQVPLVMQKAVAQLFVLLTPKAEDTLFNYCSWVEDTFDKLLVWSGDDSDRLELDARPAIIEIRKVMALLLQEQEIFGEKIFSYGAFVEKFERYIEVANYRNGNATDESITICSAELVPNRYFKEIFIAGMVEGDFPKRKGQSGFVSSDELRLWTSYGIAMNNPRQHAGFELALFSSLVERADKVHLSYPKYEMSGEDLIPSFFLRKENEGKEATIQFITPYHSSWVRPLSPRDALAACRWQLSGADCNEAMPSVVEKLINSLADAQEMAQARLKGQRESVYNGYLVDFVKSGAVSVPLPEFWSATKLNNYGKCPFRFWASDVLKLKVREVQEERVPVKLLGQAVHLCLEHFYKRATELELNFEQASYEDCLPILRQAFSEAMTWLESQNQFVKSKFWELEKIDIAFKLDRFLSYELERFKTSELKLVPRRFEVGFGGDTNCALELDCGQDRIAVRGVIDRIDLYETGSNSVQARIVDYKWGSTYISPKEALEGRNLQMPLYVMAVEQAIIPGSKVVAADYLSVSGGTSIGHLEDKKNMAEVVQKTKEHVGNFVEGIKKGDFTVRPNTYNVCTNCDHHSVCRISELRNRQETYEYSD